MFEYQKSYYDKYDYPYKVNYLPLTLPISLEEIKSHLRLEECDESLDSYLLMLGKSAVNYAENFTRRDFITKRYLTYRECFYSPITLKKVGIKKIDWIKYLSNGSLTTFSSDNYYITDEVDYYGCIFLEDGSEFPSVVDNKAQSISIQFWAGMGIEVSGITRASDVSIATTVSDHNFVTGDSIVIAGANESEFNGTFIITATGAKTFTFDNNGTDGTSTGNFISANKIPSDIKLALLNHIAKMYETRGDCPEDYANELRVPSETKQIYSFYKILEVGI